MGDTAKITVATVLWGHIDEKVCKLVEQKCWVDQG